MRATLVPARRLPSEARALSLLRRPLHAGVAEVVEVLQPPFPWQADLARALHRPGKAGKGRPSAACMAGACEAPALLGRHDCRCLCSGYQPMYYCPVAAAGAGVAATPPLERLAAFAVDWLRARTSAPATRRALPHVLTNRTVLEAGRSLKYLSHPWLPQCILGYRSSRVSREEEEV